MKKYKKPTSILVALDLDNMICESYKVQMDNCTKTAIIGGEHFTSNEEGVEIVTENHSRGWDCWE